MTPCPPALAQTSGACTGSLDWILGTNQDDQSANCSGFRCYPPVASEPVFEPAFGCNPALGPCSITATVELSFPGNHQNEPTDIGFNYTFATVEVRDSSDSLLGVCGHAGQVILEDTGTVQWGFTGACGDTDVAFQVQARSCPCQGPFCPLCQHVTTVTADLNDSNFCPEPPKEDCPGANAYSCTNCLGVGGGGAPPGGGGGGYDGKGETGPGARLAYKAGGAGHPGWPGTAGWLPTLGRYWSHDYAQRIVPDPDAVPSDGHVWLITDRVTFREFSNLSGGVYQTTSPTDEYRTLRKVGAGWELTDLDGTVMAFDAAGKWTSTTDRFGNPKTGFYNALDQLERVTFADQREELFTYDAVTGKLDTLTEVGVGGSPARTWTYTWDGDDLERIDLPDGRAYEFFYEDLLLPGYLTRVELVGTMGGREVDVAWEYDTTGNVLAIWRGDASKIGPDAVNLWELSFDDPALPVETTVLDPLGATSTYTFGRDEGSRKARLEELSGSCPACGMTPNSNMDYDDPDHPLRPTRETNAQGVHTDFTYGDLGQVLTRTEASGKAVERTTSWTYHSTYPALVTEIEQPSVAGGASVRTTTMGYNSEGALEERRIEGAEAPGGAFSYSTFYTPTDEGLPEVVDPPGYGTDDLTTTVYDSTRGSLLAESRTDPLIGTTTFAYDGYNRRTGVTDPNGVTTTTMYDAADRVTFLIQEGATPAEDLVTEHRYDEFGRLFQTVLPEGNVIEYGYDAAGRLVWVERKPNDQPTSHGERTVYTLDAAGNRTREEQQRWDGAGWVTESFTDYTWANRCQMKSVDHADGSQTEYAYDCEGNLEKVWDANHPSTTQQSGQTEIPTTMYSYDALDRL
ncbi:MAG: hypothetical protein SX243_07470, partial [Acidobacteriota bacterium]|nr:hypothetical protein [Acidobacteriota bacterium]